MTLALQAERILSIAPWQRAPVSMGHCASAYRLWQRKLVPLLYKLLRNQGEARNEDSSRPRHSMPGVGLMRGCESSVLAKNSCSVGLRLPNTVSPPFSSASALLSITATSTCSICSNSPVSAPGVRRVKAWTLFAIRHCSPRHSSRFHLTRERG